jgi:hypothetical protein
MGAAARGVEGENNAARGAPRAILVQRAVQHKLTAAVRQDAVRHILCRDAVDGIDMPLTAKCAAKCTICIAAHSVPYALCAAM